MNTKKCSKCGWEFDRGYQFNTCPFCHTSFAEGWCSHCKEYGVFYKSTQLCKACKCMKHRIWPGRTRKMMYRANVERAINKFVRWQEKINSVPKPLETLTEKQWLAACKHFGGCALCSTHSIDARTFFIHFKDGGRYCDWNIIPTCDKCATRMIYQRNPFKRVDNILNAHQIKASGVTPAHIAKIVAYLEVRINERINAEGSL